MGLPFMRGSRWVCGVLVVRGLLFMFEQDSVNGRSEMKTYRFFCHL